jgi:hypothetical protein
MDARPIVTRARTRVRFAAMEHRENPVDNNEAVMAFINRLPPVPQIPNASQSETSVEAPGTRITVVGT